MTNSAPRAGIAVGVVALIACAPQTAWACAVCASGQGDESRTAFILTTALLTALPLSMLGGLLWWLRRRLQKLERGPARDRVRVPEVSRASSSP